MEVHVDLQQPLAAGDQGAIFPPMAGGSDKKQRKEIQVNHKCCIEFHEVGKSDVHLAGGKGANLGEMVRATLPVPPGFVISAPAFREMMAANGLVEKIDRLLNSIDRNDSTGVRAIERPIRDLIETAEIPTPIRHAISEYYRRLGDNVCVAVRSSATAEDLDGASFAGQQDTFLNIVGEEALLNAVKSCWSSLYTSNAIFYREQRGFAKVLVSMAVVVQKMIESEKSGVIFTVDPVTRNPYQTLVEGVWGLGEGIVSGAITPDHFKVDNETYEVIFSYKAPKTVMYCCCGACGIETVPVPPELSGKAVLTTEELTDLVKIGNAVAAYFGTPQDIEWGIEKGKIYILQSRPITNLS